MTLNAESVRSGSYGKREAMAGGGVFSYRWDSEAANDAIAAIGIEVMEENGQLEVQEEKGEEEE